MDGPVGPAGRPQALLVPTHGGRHDVEHLHDGRPEGRDEVRRPPGDVVGHAPALAVGHVREGDERGGMRNGVGLFDRVPHGVDVGVAGLVGLVDGDPTLRPEPEAGALGQPDLRPHTYGTDHEIGGEHPSVLEGDGAVPDRRDLRPQPEVHPLGDQLVLHEDGHLGIQWRQHLRRSFDHRHAYALGNQVFRHLQADETGTYDHCVHWRRFQVFRQVDSVLHGAQSPHSLVPRDGRAHRCRPHAQDQLVEAENALLTGQRGPGRYGMRGPVDGNDLHLQPDVEAEPV